ncbi:DUF86 domain-containing protein [Enterobacter hormaechei]|uniref:HepT-like ribonuclease domain-containing protein n=1 Tax=Enterobacter hormaechei TaxID=158836 RepID=UPI002E18842A|nr:HepT-like ribonuclease domain-containing protein [Enterobacter hormaechei]MEC5970034.1 HepT-like ribonuclease domain-containing protein [Enterobacter hormaechei]
MSENRLPDYLDHIQQAATDARSFVEGMAKDDFLADKRTQQAVIMSLIVIGEAATKVMDGYVEFTQAHADVPWRSMRNMRNRRHCCKVSDEAAFCLIQRPYISKTLLTRRISPRGSP